MTVRPPSTTSFGPLAAAVFAFRDFEQLSFDLIPAVRSYTIVDPFFGPVVSSVCAQTTISWRSSTSHTIPTIGSARRLNRHVTDVGRAISDRRVAVPTMGRHRMWRVQRCTLAAGERRVSTPSACAPCTSCVDGADQRTAVEGCDGRVAELGGEGLEEVGFVMARSIRGRRAHRAVRWRIAIRRVRFNGVLSRESRRSRLSSSMVEQWTFNPLVQGSSPWGGTSNPIRDLALVQFVK